MGDCVTVEVVGREWVVGSLACAIWVVPAKSWIGVSVGRLSRDELGKHVW